MFVIIMLNNGVLNISMLSIPMFSRMMVGIGIVNTDVRNIAVANRIMLSIDVIAAWDGKQGWRSRVAWWETGLFVYVDRHPRVTWVRGAEVRCHRRVLLAKT